MVDVRCEAAHITYENSSPNSRYNTCMRTFPKRRLIFGLAILAISLLLLLWGLWPAPAELRTVPVFPADMQLPTPQSGLLLPLAQQRAAVLNEEVFVCFGDVSHPRNTQFFSVLGGPLEA